MAQRAEPLDRIAGTVYEMAYPGADTDRTAAREQQAMPQVVDTIEELVAGATHREQVHPDDGKSGAAFETLRIDGRRRFLKVVAHEDDWIMRVRATPIMAGRHLRPPSALDRSRDRRHDARHHRLRSAAWDPDG